MNKRGEGEIKMMIQVLRQSNELMKLRTKGKKAEVKKSA